jgi:hypothetical protein
VLVAVAYLLLSRTSFPQTSEKTLTFEVASVKAAPTPIATKDVYTEGYNAGMRAALASAGMRIAGQRVNITDNSLKDLHRSRSRRHRRRSHPRGQTLGEKTGGPGVARRSLKREGVL